MTTPPSAPAQAQAQTPIPDSAAVPSPSPSARGRRDGPRGPRRTLFPHELARLIPFLDSSDLAVRHAARLHVQQRGIVLPTPRHHLVFLASRLAYVGNPLLCHALGLLRRAIGGLPGPAAAAAAAIVSTRAQHVTHIGPPWQPPGALWTALSTSRGAAPDSPTKDIDHVSGALGDVDDVNGAPDVSADEDNGDVATVEARATGDGDLLTEDDDTSQQFWLRVRNAGVTLVLIAIVYPTWRPVNTILWERGATVLWAGAPRSLNWSLQLCAALVFLVGVGSYASTADRTSPWAWGLRSPTSTEGGHSLASYVSSVQTAATSAAALAQRVGFGPLAGGDSSPAHVKLDLQALAILNIENPVIAQTVEEIVQLLMRDYFHTWWGKISGEQLVVWQTETLMRTAIAVLRQRFLRVNWAHVIAQNIVPLFTAHARSYRVAEVYSALKESESMKVAGDTFPRGSRRTKRGVGRGPGEGPSAQTILEFISEDIHPALHSVRDGDPEGKRHSELAYSRRLFSHIVPLLMPSTMAGQRATEPATITLFREIIIGSVVQPTIAHLSNPTTLNTNIDYLADQVIAEEENLSRKVRDTLERQQAVDQQGSDPQVNADKGTTAATTTASARAQSTAETKSKEKAYVQTYNVFMKTIRSCDSIDTALHLEDRIGRELAATLVKLNVLVQRAWEQYRVPIPVSFQEFAMQSETATAGTVRQCATLLTDTIGVIRLLPPQVALRGDLKLHRTYAKKLANARSALQKRIQRLINQPSVAAQAFSRLSDRDRGTTSQVTLSRALLAQRSVPEMIAIGADSSDPAAQSAPLGRSSVRPSASGFRLLSHAPQSAGVKPSGAHACEPLIRGSLGPPRAMEEILRTPELLSGYTEYIGEMIDGDNSEKTSETQGEIEAFAPTPLPAHELEPLLFILHDIHQWIALSLKSCLPASVMSTWQLCLDPLQPHVRAGSGESTSSRPHDEVRVPANTTEMVQLYTQLDEILTLAEQDIARLLEQRTLRPFLQSTYYMNMTADTLFHDLAAIHLSPAETSAAALLMALSAPPGITDVAVTTTAAGLGTPLRNVPLAMPTPKNPLIRTVSRLAQMASNRSSVVHGTTPLVANTGKNANTMDTAQHSESLQPTPAVPSATSMDLPVNSDHPAVEPFSLPITSASAAERPLRLALLETYEGDRYSEGSSPPAPHDRPAARTQLLSSPSSSQLDWSLSLPPSDGLAHSAPSKRHTHDGSPLLETPSWPGGGSGQGSGDPLPDAANLHGVSSSTITPVVARARTAPMMRAPSTVTALDMSDSSMPSDTDDDENDDDDASDPFAPNDRGRKMPPSRRMSLYVPLQGDGKGHVPAGRVTKRGVRMGAILENTDPTAFQDTSLALFQNQAMLDVEQQMTRLVAERDHVQLLLAQSDAVMPPISGHASAAVNAKDSAQQRQYHLMAMGLDVEWEKLQQVQRQLLESGLNRAFSPERIRIACLSVATLNQDAEHHQEITHPSDPMPEADLSRVMNPSKTFMAHMAATSSKRGDDGKAHRAIFEKYLRALITKPDICRSLILRRFLASVALNHVLDTVLEPEADVARDKDKKTVFNHKSIWGAIQSGLDDVNPFRIGGGGGGAPGALDATTGAALPATTPDGIGMAGAKGGRLGLSAATAASTSSTVIQLFFELFFDLKGDRIVATDWMRKQAIQLLVQRLFSETVERRIMVNFEWFLGEDNLAYQLSWLRDYMWPDRAAKPPDTEAVASPQHPVSTTTTGLGGANGMTTAAYASGNAATGMNAGALKKRPSDHAPLPCGVSMASASASTATASATTAAAMAAAAAAAAALSAPLSRPSRRSLLKSSDAVASLSTGGSAASTRRGSLTASLLPSFISDALHASSSSGHRDALRTTASSIAPSHQASDNQSNLVPIPEAGKSLPLLSQAPLGHQDRPHSVGDMLSSDTPHPRSSKCTDGASVASVPSAPAVPFVPAPTAGDPPPPPEMPSPEYMDPFAPPPLHTLSPEAAAAEEARRQLEASMKLAQDLQTKLVHLIPELLGRTVGKQNARHGAERLWRMFQSQILNQDLVYRIFDVVIATLFPEVASLTTNGVPRKKRAAENTGKTAHPGDDGKHGDHHDDEDRWGQGYGSASSRHDTDPPNPRLMPSLARRASRALLFTLDLDK
ncbi:hypothetical protein CXG81DRAFT_28277 [Caulochytrium protostelioides]|uniref:PXA domain-containing protein n=1 Tax=Caulochytrium protostelioides TaxID=1555241 RepID=A0A4P9X2R6_9FUNG|nr:hypothetical protein CXG81DRAFT_28277 [Caulochytrium protostelioides]|eukprot:RKO98926.1 hypothetical protein CXG81DRAFT_28277 [Caulochytrium protostelioides]